MSTTGIAAQEVNLSLNPGFLRNGSLEACCRRHNSQLANPFFHVDSVAMACNLNPGPHPLTSVGQVSSPDPDGGPSFVLRASPSLLRPAAPSASEDHLISSFGGLSLTMNRNSDETPSQVPGKSGPLLSLPLSSVERSARPLPPLPIAENFLHDEVDREVEFLTSSDTDFLLENCASPGFKLLAQGRRSFRGCGQINYAYFDTPAEVKPQQASCPGTVCPPPPPPQQQPHRRLRRSHSGPAGSFNKPSVRVSSHLCRSSPSSDDDKPEVPPRVPLPPRPLKPDYRRWSAEVTSGAYSDEDKPPKVPPREPLPWSHSRTPSPKTLPAYLHGVMPPTQSFAPDPKYVSSKALQRQNSEGSAHKVPCILPIIENGKKVSSTHYYLLPERPPYLDKYEMFFREAEEGSLRPEEGRRQAGHEAATLVKADLGGLVKRKHLACMVSP
ncbi:ERBB receptor feedback inhibitor 1 isoform X1 [Ahaetulla prasina]|uniref:ERBB receptor feedback inhibitor 1 isoform X1 n=1 Tax=Ahaetulla prasina TaxID=499056 RepID=UPI002648FF4C|nr:ERBB receptor feedback inhibitor 1 isoform X1 [Ahaetulla prasina]